MSVAVGCVLAVSGPVTLVIVCVVDAGVFGASIVGASVIVVGTIVAVACIVDRSVLGARTVVGCVVDGSGVGARTVVAGSVVDDRTVVACVVTVGACFVGVTDGEKAEHKIGHRLKTKFEKR